MGDNDLSSKPSSSTSSNAAAEVHGDKGGMTVDKCQEIIQKSLSNLSDPKVKVLVENLEKSGCKLRSNFVRAINCAEKNLGGLQYSGEKIVLCSNNLESEEKVVSTLTHELIHAYDYCRGNLRHELTDEACSEIRAYGLSDQCHIMKERGFPLRYLGFNRKKEVDQECVKRRAIWSLKFMGYSADEAKSAVEANWSRCYADTAPFAPKLRHSFQEIWSRIENEDLFCCNLFE